MDRAQRRSRHQSIAWYQFYAWANGWQFANSQVQWANHKFNWYSWGAQTRDSLTVHYDTQMAFGATVLNFDTWGQCYELIGTARWW